MGQKGAEAVMKGGRNVMQARGVGGGQDAEGGMGQAARVVALLAITLVGSFGALTVSSTQTSAQGVPLPVPAPKRGAVRPATPAAIPGLPRDALGRPIPARPPSEIFAYDGSQRAIVDRVSAYLSSVQVLSGDFVQIGPDGGRTVGKFYLQKPGRVRFDYDPPSPLDVIADGSSVVVRDRRLATQDLYPLSQTPLRFLLADQIDLVRDTNLVGVSQDNNFISVTIEERQLFVGTHRLMLMFSAKDMQLRQWTVTDPQGYDTTVAIYNIDTVHRPDPNLFRINY
jgi:outer membrane lipoprotein-sorting protein